MIETSADRAITVTIDGPATLQGFASADPIARVIPIRHVHDLHEGRALAVIRPTGSGTITVTFTAEGLEPASSP